MSNRLDDEVTNTATARSLVFDAERRFEAAGIYYGHGTDNARDEAVFLVFHALGLPFDATDRVLDATVSAGELARVEALISERIALRIPAAYLANRMWFAGHQFYVDQRVLIPRSPIAELILEDFEPWLAQHTVTRILDIGTGSGCIAIATALAFPGAQVDATDIDPAALEVAARNVSEHGLAERVTLHQVDLFPPLVTIYDLMLANPPYVPHAEAVDLPPEYHHEPRLALFADDAGMFHVKRILAGAAERLNAGGILVMDVGGIWPAVDAAFPNLPFTWVELAHGGDGICVLTQAELARFALE
ncbi:MAG: 50S ribosomal protein L3 N(5)-glutamine methyltransferase [Gammaproteobacteria bacterium]|nr:50S ribosomal protein L3 N(5)-glutamine methyltransferase [Gammaproteobacteria bacterium]